MEKKQKKGIIPVSLEEVLRFTISSESAVEKTQTGMFEIRSHRHKKLLICDYCDVFIPEFLWNVANVIKSHSRLLV